MGIREPFYDYLLEQIIILIKTFRVHIENKCLPDIIVWSSLFVSMLEMNKKCTIMM